MYQRQASNIQRDLLNFPLSLQFSDTYSNKMADGILVYYVSAQPGKITAFKPASHHSVLQPGFLPLVLIFALQGFRMLVGDPLQRSRPDTSLKRQNCYRCYTGPNYGGDVSAPCQDAKSVLFSTW